MAIAMANLNNGTENAASSFSCGGKFTFEDLRPAYLLVHLQRAAEGQDLGSDSQSMTTHRLTDRPSSAAHCIVQDA